MSVPLKVKILMLLMSLTLTLSLISNTYSRYAANTTGNLEGSFAKWQILVNNSDITDKTNSSISLVPIIEENEFVAENKIAPASKGYFDIDINPENVELSFDYTISLNIENENIPDLIITKYSIIDGDYVEGDELQINNVEDNLIEGSLNFKKDVENYKFDSFTIRIYFEWYEGLDEEMDDVKDTEIGINNINNPLRINANINFKQKLA